MDLTNKNINYNKLIYKLSVQQNQHQQQLGVFCCNFPKYFNSFHNILIIVFILLVHSSSINKQSLQIMTRQFITLQLRMINGYNHFFLPETRLKQSKHLLIMFILTIIFLFEQVDSQLVASTSYSNEQVPYIQAGVLDVYPQTNKTKSFMIVNFKNTFSSKPSEQTTTIGLMSMDYEINLYKPGAYRFKMYLYIQAPYNFQRNNMSLAINYMQNRGNIIKISYMVIDPGCPFLDYFERFQKNFSPSTILQSDVKAISYSYSTPIILTYLTQIDLHPNVDHDDFMVQVQGKFRANFIYQVTVTFSESFYAGTNIRVRFTFIYPQQIKQYESNLQFQIFSLIYTQTNRSPIIQINDYEQDKTVIIGGMTDFSYIAVECASCPDPDAGCSKCSANPGFQYNINLETSNVTGDSTLSYDIIDAQFIQLTFTTLLINNIQCPSGYPIKRLNQTSNKTQCYNQCPIGQYPSTYNNITTCQKCYQSCQTCDTGDQCQTCYEGYGFDSNYLCINLTGYFDPKILSDNDTSTKDLVHCSVKFVGCSTCDYQGKWCNTCTNTYYILYQYDPVETSIIISGQCKLCSQQFSQGCLYCSSTRCNQCKTNYTYINATTCFTQIEYDQMCDDGLTYYYTHPGTGDLSCAPCNSYCKTCEKVNNGECTDCYVGNRLEYGQCYYISDIYFDNNYTTGKQASSYDLQLCSDGFSGCTACTINGIQCDSCQDGYYHWADIGRPDTGQCYLCNVDFGQGCLLCEYDRCNQCQENYTRINSTTCYTQQQYDSMCTQQYYYYQHPSTLDHSCIACQSYCKTCEKIQGNCTSCYTGNLLRANGSCTYYTGPYYDPQYDSSNIASSYDLPKCSQKWNGCVSCNINAVHCNGCSAGYILKYYSSAGVIVNGNCTACSMQFNRHCYLCTSSKCTQCSPGYVLVNASSCLTQSQFEGMCQPSEYQSYNQVTKYFTCETCLSECLTCDQSSKCKTCYRGNYLKLSTGRCEYAEGFYDPNYLTGQSASTQNLPECSLAINGCLSCDIGGFSCYYCDEGYFLNSINSCEECKNTFGFTCLKCDISRCIECMSGYVLMNSQKCISNYQYQQLLSLYPNGKFQSFEIDQQLQERCTHDNCSECEIINKSNCTLCKSELAAPNSEGICENLCGNGEITSLTGQQCDDGNPYNFDGCSSKCIVEDGFRCQTRKIINRIIVPGPPDQDDPEPVYQNTSIYKVPYQCYYINKINVQLMRIQKSLTANKVTLKFKLSDLKLRVWLWYMSDNQNDLGEMFDVDLGNDGILDDQQSFYGYSLRAEFVLADSGITYLQNPKSERSFRMTQTEEFYLQNFQYINLQMTYFSKTQSNGQRIAKSTSLNQQPMKIRLYPIIFNLTKNIEQNDANDNLQNHYTIFQIPTWYNTTIDTTAVPDANSGGGGSMAILEISSKKEPKNKQRILQESISNDLLSTQTSNDLIDVGAQIPSQSTQYPFSMFMTFDTNLTFRLVQSNNQIIQYYSDDYYSNSQIIQNVAMIASLVVVAMFVIGMIVSCIPSEKGNIGLLIVFRISNLTQLSFYSIIVSGFVLQMNPLFKSVANGLRYNNGLITDIYSMSSQTQDFIQRQFLGMGLESMKFANNSGIWVIITFSSLILGLLLKVIDFKTNKNKNKEQYQQTSSNNSNQSQISNRDHNNNIQTHKPYIINNNNNINESQLSHDIDNQQLHSTTFSRSKRSIIIPFNTMANIFIANISFPFLLFFSYNIWTSIWIQVLYSSAALNTMDMVFMGTTVLTLSCHVLLMVFKMEQIYGESIFFKIKQKQMAHKYRNYVNESQVPNVNEQKVINNQNQNPQNKGQHITRRLKLSNKQKSAAFMLLQRLINSSLLMLTMNSQISILARIVSIVLSIFWIVWLMFSGRKQILKYFVSSNKAIIRKRYTLPNAIKLLFVALAMVSIIIQCLFVYRQVDLMFEKNATDMFPIGYQESEIGVYLPYTLLALLILGVIVSLTYFIYSIKKLRCCELSVEWDKSIINGNMPKNEKQLQYEKYLKKQQQQQNQQNQRLSNLTKKQLQDQINQIKQSLLKNKQKNQHLKSSSITNITNQEPTKIQKKNSNNQLLSEDQNESQQQQYVSVQQVQQSEQLQNYNRNKGYGKALSKRQSSKQEQQKLQILNQMLLVKKRKQTEQQSRIVLNANNIHKVLENEDDIIDGEELQQISDQLKTVKEQEKLENNIKLNKNQIQDQDSYSSVKTNKASKLTHQEIKNEIKRQLNNARINKLVKSSQQKQHITKRQIMKTVNSKNKKQDQIPKLQRSDTNIQIIMNRQRNQSTIDKNKNGRKNIRKQYKNTLYQKRISKSPEKSYKHTDPQKYMFDDQYDQI